MTTNGERLQAQFLSVGLRVKLVEEIESPQCATYYYDCLNINDYSRKRIEKLLEKLSAYNHLKLTYVEGNEKAHFGVSQAILNRQPLFLTTFHFEENKGNVIKIPIGKDLNNKVVELDFGKIPHILIGGTTGSGKSVLINTIITSLLVTTPYWNFGLTLIDPKRVELAPYKPMPNVKFIDETNEAVAYLSELCNVMEERYALLESMGKKDGTEIMKPIFVVVDELADLMLSSRYEVEESIVRLAQKSRAVNIHLILATQRPSANVITGLIKANMSCRIALKTASFRDSIILLDHKGAEDLLGFGDCLIKLPYQTEEIRTQIAYVSQERIREMVDYRRGGN